MTGRILIVDDHMAVRESLAHQLARAGHEVHKSGDTEEALVVAGEWAPDIVLTDIRMPGRDGLELLRQLAETSTRVNLVLCRLLIASIQPTFP